MLCTRVGIACRVWVLVKVCVREPVCAGHNSARRLPDVLRVLGLPPVFEVLEVVQEGLVLKVLVLCKPLIGGLLLLFKPTDRCTSQQAVELCQPNNAWCAVAV